MLVYWSVVLLKDPQKKLNGSKGDASIRPPKKMALFETNKKNQFLALTEISTSTLESWSLSWYRSRWQQELVKEIWKENSCPTSHASNNCFLNFQKSPPLSFLFWTVKKHDICASWIRINFTNSVWPSRKDVYMLLDNKTAQWLHQSCVYIILQQQIISFSKKWPIWKVSIAKVQ